MGRARAVTRAAGRTGADPAAMRVGAVAALCLVQFVDVLGATVTITALPRILTGLGAPASAATLVVTGYAMCFGGLLLLGARMGDRWGHRRVLLGGLAVFGAASLMAATATSIALLVAARCLQGAAAAASVPPALRLLTSVAPDGPARRRALAAWSAAGAAAGASGFLLGGVLTDLAGWRSVFWINLPLAALLVVAVWRTTPGTPPEDTRRLDLAGAALLTGAVMGLVLGGALLERPAGRPGGLALAAAGGALLLAFARVERRVANPLLPGPAARQPTLRAGGAASFLNTATTSSAMTLATLHLQDVAGASPTRAGLSLLPFSLAVVAGSALAPRVLAARGPRAGAGIGLAVIAAGNAALLALPVSATVLPAAVALAGAGIGLSSVAATTLGTDVPQDLQGTAAGALNTAAQLGTALGVAAVVLVATSTEGAAFPLAGSPLGWALAALAAAAGALLLARPRSVDGRGEEGNGARRGTGAR